MSKRFAKDYVVVKIDQDRMTEGAVLAAELRAVNKKAKGGGIPWSVMLDGTGRQVITSDGPKGNIGCPAQPHEIDFFFEMVDKTRTHMSDGDREVLEKKLRAYGKELTRPLKRG